MPIRPRGVLLRWVGNVSNLPKNPDFTGSRISGDVIVRKADRTDTHAALRLVLGSSSELASDEQVVEYTWTDNKASWTLISAGQLKAQDASYTLTPDGDKTKVKFDITIDLSVPLPGFVLKRAMKGAMETATDGLRKQVLKVKKGGK